MTYFDKQNLWLEKANELLPILQHEIFKPLHVVNTISDTESFQGWRVNIIGTVEEIYQKTYGGNDSFILDFGEHITGYLKFKINKFGQHDAPLRLKFIFGEVPAEVSEPFDPKTAGLSRSWLQDEIINIDETPIEINLPRRYAFRYLKIELIDTSSNYRIGFADIICDAVTSGSFDLPVDTDIPADLLLIDQVSLRTLRDCMQTVYEDGPKRDRRLWLGDLRLMMMSNAVSFRNFDLVRRCLYLFAGLAQDDGLVAGCVYERPVPSLGNNLLTYSCLMASVLYDYAIESGDWQTAEELLPVAARQLDIVWENVNEEGLFCNLPGTWLFFDWCPELNHTAAMQATVIYCLRALLKLALQAGDENLASVTEKRLAKMALAAESMYDEKSGLFVSGENNQISWGSQAWMVLAEVVTGEKAVGVLRRMIACKEAIKP
ncbi:MAG: sugar hydrolase, partial [bacterium]